MRLDDPSDRALHDVAGGPCVAEAADLVQEARVDARVLRRW